MRIASQQSPESIAPKSMLMDLHSARQALVHLQGHAKDYDALLTAILAIPNDAKLPTASALQKQCSTASGRLRQWLEALYQDFLAAIETQTLFHFTQADHCFVVSGPRDYLSFRCRVPATPRPGDRIELGFVSGVTGSSDFYVDSTLAEYHEGEITTYVYLRAGSDDPYLRQLRARARFEGKLSYVEEREMDEHELREYLRELYA